VVLRYPLTTGASTAVGPHCWPAVHANCRLHGKSFFRAHWNSRSIAHQDGNWVGLGLGHTPSVPRKARRGPSTCIKRNNDLMLLFIRLVVGRIQLQNCAKFVDEGIGRSKERQISEDLLCTFILAVQCQTGVRLRYRFE
jgi:hypothetical protein